MTVSARIQTAAIDTAGWLQDINESDLALVDSNCSQLEGRLNNCEQIRMSA